MAEREQSAGEFEARVAEWLGRLPVGPNASAKERERLAEGEAAVLDLKRRRGEAVGLSSR